MRVAALSSAILLAVGVTACSGEAPDDPVGASQQAQIVPPMKDYVVYTLMNDAGLQLGQVLVTATAGDGYAANTEYWYMTSNLSNSSAVTFVGGTPEYWSTPPTGLGTLSFSTSRTPTWSSATARGTYPVYSNALTGEYDGLNWQMTNTGGTWSYRGMPARTAVAASARPAEAY